MACLPELSLRNRLLRGARRPRGRLREQGRARSIGLLHIVIFAFLFGARVRPASVLPMLLAGDVDGVTAFHQHALGLHRRMLPRASG